MKRIECRCIIIPMNQGKYAVTHYNILEEMYYISLIKCQLETGRTHQIRVHLNLLAIHFFNDARYGGDEILKGTVYSKYRQFVQNCFETCPRQALHAHTLDFVHPTTQRKCFYTTTSR